MTKIIKKQIIQASKFQLKLGFNIGSEGNISVKKSSNIFITPSGKNTCDLKEKDISVIDINGNILNNNKPSSETNLHLMIYKLREGIKAIVHCHSPWASILSCLRKDIPAFHYMVAEFGGTKIKCADYDTFGTKKLAKNVVKAIDKSFGCLIGNHGQICIGKSLNHAINLSRALEKLSMQYYFCLLSGKVKLLRESEIKKVLNLFEDYKSID